MKYKMEETGSVRAKRILGEVDVITVLFPARSGEFLSHLNSIPITMTN